MSLTNKFQLLELSDDEDTPKTKTTPVAAAKAPETKAAAPAPAQQKKQEAKVEAPKTVEKPQVSKDSKTEKKPRPPRQDGEKKDGEKKDGDKPRAPRADGDKPRAPRADGDKPRAPRADGDKPRQDGDRPRRPRRGEEEAPLEQPEKTESGEPKSDLPSKKRQFDRRGPRRNEGEKAEFHGKGNWGKPGSESTPEAVASETTDGSAEQSEKPVETPAPTVAVPEQEQDKTMTLSEFKKIQAAQKKTVAAPAPVRSANEGVDLSAWKNTEQLVRSEDAYFVPPEKSSKKKETKVTERKAPETIEINPKPLIEDKIRERKSYGGPRKQKTKVPEPPKPEDTNAFPKLK